MNNPAPQYERLLKEALLTIRKLRQQHQEPIAVVGVGCRFPGGVSSPDELWTVLQRGADTIDRIPPDRWDADSYYDPDPDAPGKMCTLRSGFLASKDLFDPQFFRISPREATYLDPQQRVLLEVAWEALEHAHIPAEKLRDTNTGVFVGISAFDYGNLMAEYLPEANLDPTVGTGSGHSPASGRLSYFFGFRGPCVSVDTACSSSLVAVQAACDSLRRGECDTALAGGVNMILSPLNHVVFSRAHMLAPDGRCKTFDDAADGYVRSEGAGVIVLKRLSDATADGNTILALLKGGAVNHGGASGGLTVPNGPAQQEVIRTALRNAAVAAASVDYVEAHGTGTALGDPIEVLALADVYGAGRDGRRPLMIGSAKTNLGHMEAAAGIAGLVKVILQLQRNAIAPHLHLETPSRRIPWARLPIAVPTELTPWLPQDGRPRLAGVSSYGFSGTNAHVIVEEAPSRPRQTTAPADRPVHVLTLSAKGDAALQALVDRYVERLEGADGNVADLAYSANTGRSHFKRRLAVVGSSIADMHRSLVAFKGGTRPRGVHVGSLTGEASPKLAFLFTGQGSEAAGMGRELYETSPCFREVIDACDGLVRREKGWSVVSALYADSPGQDIHQTAYAQPLLFALEYALASLWRSWGIEPTYLAGHSVGEYAAAAVAGVFSMDDGLRLLLARGELMQQLPRGGGMVTIHAPLDTVEAALEPYRSDASIAAINGPKSVVVSGSLDSLGMLVASFDREGVHTQRLNVSHAFHSPLMEPMLDAFRDVAAGVRYSPPEQILVSTVTGREVGAELTSPDYWVRHISLPVRFADAVHTLDSTGCTAFVEIGPRPILLSAARASSSRVRQRLASLDPKQSDWQQMVDSLAALYADGHTVDWAAFDRDYSRSWVSLPTYPFQRQRYWFASDAVQRKLAPQSERRRHALLGSATANPAGAGEAGAVVFESRLADDTPRFLHDHRVFGSTVFPAAGYVELALAAVTEVCGDRPGLKNIVIHTPLVLRSGSPSVVQTRVEQNAGESHVQIRSRADEEDASATEWRLHAEAVLEVQQTTTAAACNLETIHQELTTALEVEPYYGELRARGLEYGPSFRCIQELRADGSRVLARLRLPDSEIGEKPDYLVHPILLDGAFQSVAAGLAMSREDETYLPTGIESVRRFKPLGVEHWIEARARDDARAGARRITADVRIFAADGEVALEVSGLQLTRVRRGALRRAFEGDPRDLMYRLMWRRLPIDRTGSRVAPDRILILADEGGAAESLLMVLHERGVDAVLVRAGGTGAIEAEELSRLLAVPDQHVLDFRGLDTPALQPGEPVSLESTGNLGCDRLLQIARQMARSGTLWLFTRGAFAVDPRSPNALEQAALSGLLTAIAAEGAIARCAHVDLDPAPGDRRRHVEANQLAAEVLGGALEERVAFRRGLRYVAQLARLGRPATAAPARRITLTKPGVIENLAVEPMLRQRPTRGEVEIAVRVGGVNFKDVLYVLGLLQLPQSEGSAALGYECSGVVVDVGDGVEGVSVGDRVIAFGTRCLASHVTVNAGAVVSMPPNLTFEEAAAVPTAFLTAYHALYTLARVQPGDTVLVHAGAGGVGQAAIQLCRRVGATIFATASAGKAALLEAEGIALVMNSRDLQFRDEILRATGGRGVDVVLNSLNGDFIPANLDVLAAGGRFVEIGKLGAWSSEQVAAVRPDVSYFTFDLSEASGPAALSLRRVLTDVTTWLANDTVRPLTTDTFGIDEVPQAFRHLSQGRNVGKVVIRFDETANDDQAPIVRSDRSYLISGGFGGLGTKVAEYLVDHGARTLILAGRTFGASAGAAVAALQARGACVHVLSVDVADRDRLQGELGHLQSSLPPLAGIVHAAGVLDDGLLKDQTADRFRRVLAPKVLGAWNLHDLTRDLPLDWFVSFASISGVFGSPGQANYAAANAWLDAFMHHRRALGLPGSSIDWGPWASVGMAAGLDEARRKQLRSRGLQAIDVQRGLAAFRRAIQSDLSQVVVAAADWPTFARHARHAQRLIAPLVGDPAPAAGGSAASSALIGWREVDGSQRREMLLSHLRRLLASTLGFSTEKELDAGDSFLDLGMDSLSAVEFTHQLEAGLSLTLSDDVLFEHSTLDKLVDHLMAVTDLETPGVRETAA
jgi:myxalamid-type polyketide synthase MxaB